MLKIIALEDNFYVTRLWQIQFQAAGFSILCASKIAEAEVLLQTNPDADLVVVDACVESHKVDTVPFVEWARQGIFNGPMVAVSARDENNQELLMAGCSHECNDKGRLIDKVMAILGKPVS